MSSYRKNSITMYLRPLEYQQRYQIRNAAKWLVYKKKFLHFNNALRWLSYLEKTNPWVYKNILSTYYKETDYKTYFKSSVYSNNYDVNFYKTSNYNSYGDEPHMWF